MNTLTASPVVQSCKDEVVTVLVDFTPILPSGVTVTAVSGTQSGITLGASSSADLTLGSPAISGSDVTSQVDGRTIAANKAVSLAITTTSAKPGIRYCVRLKVKLSNSDVRTALIYLDMAAA